MNILQFMQKVFPSDKETQIRCLNKATIIIYDGSNILVGDSQYIYQFGSLDRSFGKSYKFYQLVKDHMIGKVLYANETEFKTYKNHCEVIDKLPDGKLKCIWKG